MKKLILLYFVVAAFVSFSLAASQVAFAAQDVPPGIAKQGKIPGKGKHKGWEKGKHKGWDKKKSEEGKGEAKEQKEEGKK